MHPDENSVLIEPKRGKREAFLPASSVLVFTPGDMDIFLQLFSAPPQKTHTICLAQVYVGTYEESAVALTGPAIGAPQAVMVLEKLIALGVREVVAVGWCGSLQSHVAIGDVVLPVAAVSEEGTSAHYPVSDSAPVPHPGLLTSMRDVIGMCGLRFHEGIVWTTDAPYRETIRKVLSHQRHGVLAVDMETSALLTLAHFRGIHLAIALVVSDDLSSLKWVHGFRDGAFHETRQKLAVKVLDVVCGKR